jgi:nitroreductase
MNINKAIKSRKSVRSFKNKKPNWRDIIECIDSARYAPMAGNNYTVKFILIDDQEKIASLSEAAQQDFFSNVYFVVVVCTDPTRTKNLYPERAEKYLPQQAGAAIENFLLKLQEKKLSTCWVGHFEENLVKRELKIPEHVIVEALFPIGYEFKEFKKRQKVNIDSILFFNEYKNKKIGEKPSVSI